jgi:hypothetical protein
MTVLPVSIGKGHHRGDSNQNARAVVLVRSVLAVQPKTAESDCQGVGGSMMPSASAPI